MYGYSEAEVADLYEEDFSGYFIGTIGPPGSKMDVITIVHHAISYEEAEKNKQVFELMPSLLLNIVPYDFLKDMKLHSARDKDLFDIARLEELRKHI